RHPEALVVPARSAHAPAEIPLRNQRTRTECGDGRKHARRHARRAEYRRLTRAEDAGLLRADELERVPEPVAMIEADGGDHGDIRRHQVGGVETAAAPPFQARNVP